MTSSQATMPKTLPNFAADLTTNIRNSNLSKEQIDALAAQFQNNCDNPNYRVMLECIHQDRLEIAGITAKIIILKRQRTSQNEQLRQQAEQLDQHRETINQKWEAIREKDVLIARLEERLRMLQEQQVHNANELHSNCVRRDVADAQVDDYSGRIVDLKTQVNTLQQNVNGRDHQIERLNRQIEALQRQNQVIIRATTPSIQSSRVSQGDHSCPQAQLRDPQSRVNGVKLGKQTIFIKQEQYDDPPWMNETTSFERGSTNAGPRIRTLADSIWLPQNAGRRRARGIGEVSYSEAM